MNRAIKFLTGLIPGGNFTVLAVGSSFMLGSAAFFAFGAWLFVSVLNKMDERDDTQNFNHGATEYALKVEQDTRAAIEAARAEAQAQAALQVKAASEAAARSRDAAVAARDALRRLKDEDAAFAACEAQLYPPDIRRHHPRGMLPTGEAPTPGNGNG